MMIVEAISSAPSEHAVYFLVTAYMESLLHFEKSSGVPEPIMRLPVRGAEDLGMRLAVLRSSTSVPPEATVPLAEVSAVLDCAIRRLRGLNGAAGEPNPALLRAA